MDQSVQYQQAYRLAAECWPARIPRAAPMQMRWWLLRAAVLPALLLVVACTRSDPETALRATVGDLQEAVEARDSAALQQFLAEDFIANEAMDRRQLRAMAAMYFRQNASVGIAIGPLDVEMKPPHNATVGSSVILTGGATGAMPDRARAYQVVSDWRMEDGEWRLYHLRWTPAL